MKSIALISIAMLSVCALHAQDARTLINEGNQLSSNRDYNSAIEKYKAALSLEANNITAKYQLGFALNAAGKGQNAIPYLQDAAEGDNSNAVKSSAFGLLGIIYDRAGKAKLAITNYTEALKNLIRRVMLCNMAWDWPTFATVSMTMPNVQR